MSSTPASSDTPALPFRGHVLRSAFQPIFSLSHQRLIGHEALLRASDPLGRSIAPQAMFAQCANDAERRRLDQACTLLHAQRFARDRAPAQWMFLNVDASVFAIDGRRSGSPVRTLLDTVAQAGLDPSQVVIELLEAALPDDDQVTRWTDELKRAGFNIALDDFGAGHSNFDRVFRLHPHIVKLDRSVIGRAAADPWVRRVMGQMVALLHECGTQVLIEGVETADEAIIALDADADFVQGYHFGRPQTSLRLANDKSREMAEIWVGCDERSRREVESNAARIAPYRAAMMEAKRLLVAGRPVDDACRSFMALAKADRCYLLDDEGKAAPHVVCRPSDSTSPTVDRFTPLLDVEGSRWSRRPYFRSALEHPGVLQVTRPYPAMHGPMMTLTLSVSFECNGRRFVICGDKTWQSGLAWPVTGTAAIESATESAPGHSSRIDHPRDPLDARDRPPPRSISHGNPAPPDDPYTCPVA